MPWQQPPIKHPIFAMPYIKGADTINEVITCSLRSLKIKVEINTPISIPTPAPRPENDNLTPSLVMETDARHEQAIVHMTVRKQVKKTVCHEILNRRINKTALPKPMNTDISTISAYGDQLKTGISICISEMVETIHKIITAVHHGTHHKDDGSDKEDDQRDDIYDDHDL